MVMSEKEKRNTAYHESGHAIVGRLVPEHDPVYKVSIIPRGRALGVTMFLPEEDKYSHSKRYLTSSICSLFGGDRKSTRLNSSHVRISYAVFCLKKKKKKIIKKQNKKR